MQAGLWERSARGHMNVLKSKAWYLNKGPELSAKIPSLATWSDRVGLD